MITTYIKMSKTIEGIVTKQLFEVKSFLTRFVTEADVIY